MRPKREISARALVFNSPVGNRPEMKWVECNILNIDDTYQRSLEAESSIALVRHIAANWNWLLCTPLSVARREDDSLWIVDGQHRHAAAQLRPDIPSLPCIIQSYEAVAHEAASFVDLNRKRRPLNAVDLFKAGLAAGNTEETAIMALLKDAGLSLAKHQNYMAWKPGQIFCVPTVRTAYRRFGRMVTQQGLHALSKSFEGQILGNSGCLLGALFSFYYSQMTNTRFDNAKFIKRLSLNTQAEWMRKIRTIMIRQELGQRVAAICALNEAYEQGLEYA